MHACMHIYIYNHIHIHIHIHIYIYIYIDPLFCVPNRGISQEERGVPQRHEGPVEQRATGGRGHRHPPGGPGAGARPGGRLCGRRHHRQQPGRQRLSTRDDQAP